MITFREASRHVSCLMVVKNQGKVEESWTKIDGFAREIVWEDWGTGSLGTREAGKESARVTRTPFGAESS
jgi:hypothetical protein